MLKYNQHDYKIFTTCTQVERCSVLKITKCCGSQKSLLWSGLTYWRKRGHRLKCLRVRPMWQEIAIPVPPKWILHVFQGDCHMTWTGICLASDQHLLLPSQGPWISGCGLSKRAWQNPRHKRLNYSSSFSSAGCGSLSPWHIAALMWKIAWSNMHLPVLLGEIIIPCQDCNGKERIYDSSGIMVKTTQAAGPVFLDLAMALTLQNPKKRDSKRPTCFWSPDFPASPRGEMNRRGAEGIQISFWRAVTQRNAPIWRTWMQLRQYSGYRTHITINSCE